MAHSKKSELVLYKTKDSDIKLEVNIKDDSVWLNRNQMAELFDRDVKTIGKHINNALREELVDIPVVANFATTAADGKLYKTDYYNLDVIISVGYRVKSQRGVDFRRWKKKRQISSISLQKIIRSPMETNELQQPCFCISWIKIMPWLTSMTRR